MKRTIIAIDMLEDTSSEKHGNPLKPFAKVFVPVSIARRILHGIKKCRLFSPWIFLCAAINMYRNNPLYRLFKIMMPEGFLKELNETESAR